MKHASQCTRVWLWCSDLLASVRERFWDTKEAHHATGCGVEVPKFSCRRRRLHAGDGGKRQRLGQLRAPSATPHDEEQPQVGTDRRARPGHSRRRGRRHDDAWFSVSIAPATGRGQGAGAQSPDHPMCTLLLSTESLSSLHKMLQLVYHQCVGPFSVLIITLQHL